MKRLISYVNETKEERINEGILDKFTTALKTLVADTDRSIKKIADKSLKKNIDPDMFDNVSDEVKKKYTDKNELVKLYKAWENTSISLSWDYLKKYEKSLEYDDMKFVDAILRTMDHMRRDKDDKKSRQQKSLRSHNDSSSDDGFYASVAAATYALMNN